jgi:hypothetical protein
MNTVRFPRNFRLAFSLVLGFVIAGVSAARAQEFVFTKIVDSNDPIPGGAGALFVPAEQPALDGGTIIFRNGNTLAPDGIWSVTGGISPSWPISTRPCPAAPGSSARSFSISPRPVIPC